MGPYTAAAVSAYGMPQKPIVCHVCRSTTEGLVNCGWCGKPVCPRHRERDNEVSTSQKGPYCDTCIMADGNY